MQQPPTPQNSQNPLPLTERERAVDNLITKARYAAGVYAVLPPDSRKPHEHDLKVAVDRFLEADALAARLKWGCRVVSFQNGSWGIENAERTHYLAHKWWPFTGPGDGRRTWGNYATEQEALTALASAPPPPGVEPPASDLLSADAARAEAKRASDWVDEQDRAKIPDIIDRLMDDSEAFFWYASDRRGRYGIRSSSQHGTNYIGGERSAIARLLYRRSDLNPLAANAEPADDPEATPAAETVFRGHTIDLDAEPADRSPNVQEQLDALASRVAEVERQVIHESRCRIELEGCVESMHIRFTDQIAALRRDVDALKGTGPCACKSTAPSATRNIYPCGCISCVCEDEERCHGCGAKSCGRGDRCKAKSTTTAPDALPFGCVAHQHEDGRWTIKNKGLTHYWDHVQNEWMADTSPEDGGFNSDTEALYYFRATNKGVAPPGEASIESRVTHFDSEPTTPTGSEYEVEMCPHNVNKNRVVHDGLFMLIQNGHIRWTSDAWTPLDRVDAETIAAVLRNAQ